MVREGAPPHPSTQLRSTLFSRSKNISLIFQHTVDQIAKLSSAEVNSLLIFLTSKLRARRRRCTFPIVTFEAVGCWGGERLFGGWGGERLSKQQQISSKVSIGIWWEATPPMLAKRVQHISCFLVGEVFVQYWQNINFGRGIWCKKGGNTNAPQEFGLNFYIQVVLVT